MTFMKKILITISILLCSLFAVNTMANIKSSSEDKVFKVLTSLPRFSAQDMDEPNEDRARRLRILASSITKASKKYRARGLPDSVMQSALVTIAYKESRLAKNVGIGRCDLMPKGQRCDNGKARTYFQLWEVACPDVHNPDLDPGSQEEMDIAAQCAARLLTAAYNRCSGKNKHGQWAGAFSGYRSIDCNWSPKRHYQSPKARQDYMKKIYYKIRSTKISEKEKQK